MTLTVTDLFCGAGGRSRGAENVPGVELKMATNHWQKAIPDDYRVEGTKKDRVKLYGNAVTPPVMEFLVGRVAEALAA
jgi:site-specific DNA-cytosine methylase